MYQFSSIYVIAAVAVIGGGLFGFDISSMSAILGTQAYKCYFNQGEITSDRECAGPTASVQGGITAAMPAGSWLGALISGYVSDILGRKYAIMVGAGIWLIGSTIICASQNIPMLVVGRIINGFSVGIESAQVPVYISEISPPTKRGRVVGAQQWAITWGILIMYYISYGSSFISGNSVDDYNTSAFRIPWGLQMIPAVLLLGLMLFMPESPRWLARKDRWEEAHRVLTHVHGKGDPDAPFVALEMSDIKKMCQLEARFKDVTYWELFYPKNINRTHIGMWTQIWSQLTGMNVMMYSSIQYIINVVLTVPALIWLDRWGRRKPMMIGAFLMGTFMACNAGIMGGTGEVVEGGVQGVAVQSMRVRGNNANALIACTYLFVASYAPTWGPVSWVYPPELYPLRIRGKAVALATSSNWAFNTALGAFTPPAFENIRYMTYIVFACFNFAMFIHVAILFPETAGKTLEETQAMFEDPNGLPYIGTKPWTTKVKTLEMSRMEHGQVPESKVMDDMQDETKEATTP